MLYPKIIQVLFISNEIMMKTFFDRKKGFQFHRMGLEDFFLVLFFLRGQMNSSIKNILEILFGSSGLLYFTFLPLIDFSYFLIRSQTFNLFSHQHVISMSCSTQNWKCTLMTCEFYLRTQMRIEKVFSQLCDLHFPCLQKSFRIKLIQFLAWQQKMKSFLRIFDNKENVCILKKVFGFQIKSNEATAGERMLQILQTQNQPAHFRAQRERKDSIVRDVSQMFSHVWNMFTIIFCNPAFDPKNFLSVAKTKPTQCRTERQQLEYPFTTIHQSHLAIAY